MKWPNVARVFRWEFIKNLKSPVFLITTLMMPLIMLLGGGISYFATTSIGKEEQQVAVIDETEAFFPYLERSLAGSPVKVTLRQAAEREQLSGQVEKGELNGYLFFTAENLQSGLIDYHVRDARQMNSLSLDGALQEALTRYRMEQLGLSAEEITLATAPVSLHLR
ncbi:MAG: ABC transporter permease, partial [Firmicutes bacterium]|nr:ABC transporter permease [Bacillota bacterium]